MFWFFIFIVAATLGAVMTAGMMAPNMNFALRVMGVILALVLLVIGTVFFWKHAIVALAILSVCAMAVGVMFQKVSPSRAIARTLVAFILMFVFSWLALQIAGPLLFDRDSDLSIWFSNFLKGIRTQAGYNMESSGFMMALSGACLFSACFLDGWRKAIAAFFGTLVLFHYLPAFFEGQGLSIRDYFYSHDPVSMLAILTVIVIGIVGIVRLLVHPKYSKHP